MTGEIGAEPTALGRLAGETLVAADPTTPDRTDPDHPVRYTENGLRSAPGATPRPRY